MSTFRVKLTQGDQGSLDTNAVSTGTSNQRSVYIMGPNKINRLLNDGDTFTDSNYFKRFCYPQVSKETALLELVSDDGSVYVDNAPLTSTFPLVYDLTLSADTDYDDNTSIDLEDLYGTNTYASYCQISVSTTGCKVKLNGVAALDVAVSSIQVFNPGDINIKKLEFKNTDLSLSSTVQVILGVVSPNRS